MQACTHVQICWPCCPLRSFNHVTLRVQEGGGEWMRRCVHMSMDLDRKPDNGTAVAWVWCFGRWMGELHAIPLLLLRWCLFIKGC